MTFHVAEGALRTPDHKLDNPRPLASTSFRPEFGKPTVKYTKALIIPRTKDDNVEWIHEQFEGNDNMTFFIYSVDDVSAPLHVPKNKGHGQF